MSDKKSKMTVKSNTELRLAAEEEVKVEILALPVEENIENHDDASEFGVELVQTISDSESNSDQKKINLFQSDALVDRIEKNIDDDLGKSFRSRELTEVDLSEREIMPTLEDSWVQEKSSKSNVSWVNRFIVVGVLLILAAGVWALISLDKEEITKEQRDKELKEIIISAEEQKAADARDRINLEKCVKAYLEATTIEERAKWCRDPKGTLLKMTDYYKNKLTFNNYRFESFVMTSDSNLGGKNLVIVGVNVSDDAGRSATQKKPKSLLLEKQEDGEYLVDWDTAVVYQPSDWDSFIQNKSEEPHVFRLEARERIDYGPYLYQFSDDSEYQAYRISVRGEAAKYLIGYAKKDSAIDVKMKALLLKDNKSSRSKKKIVPMVLKLVYPKDAASEQCVEIIEIVSETWFIP